MTLNDEGKVYNAEKEIKRLTLQRRYENIIKQKIMATEIENAAEHGMDSLVQDVQAIVENGLKKAYRDVNVTTVTTYWQVGRPKDSLHATCETIDSCVCVSRIWTFGTRVCQI